jgi:hypothetical protein
VNPFPAVTLEAERLETRLQAAVRASERDPSTAALEDLRILYQAALEVCELDHWLTQGFADKTIWVATQPPEAT